MTSASPKRRLTSEQRRALALLASSRPGVHAALLVYGHGFKRRVLAGLVRRGLAAAEREVVKAGGKAVQVRAHQDHGGGAEGDRVMKGNPA
jgi:hypothetical protein